MRRKTVIQRQSVYHTDMSRNLIQMIRFIEQEGREKVDEIECVTEEEYMIRKHRIINEGIAKITTTYNAKEFRAQQLDQINCGILMQESGMKKIRAKMKIFNDIESEIRLRIIHNTVCSSTKWNIIRGLIMEALFKLMESKIIIKCRKADESLLLKTIPDIQIVYENMTSQKIKIQLDPLYLPEDSLLGVCMRTPTNKISIVNTLDDRLKNVMRSSLPVLNQIFYGTSKMQK